MANENEEVQEGASQEQDQAQSNENEQVVVDQGQAEQQPVEEATPEEKASQIDHIMAMAAKDPSIKDLPEYQDMLKEMEAIDSKTQAKTENEESEENQESEESEENEEGKELELLSGASDPSKYQQLQDSPEYFYLLKSSEGILEEQFSPPECRV